MDTLRVPQFTLNDRLRKARITANITVEAMADELDCSRRTITRWESSGVRVPRSAVLAYHVRCGVDLSWLEKGLVDE